MAGNETDFWGRPTETPWWDQDVSDAGQGLYIEPSLALSLATVPQQLLAQQQAEEQEAREARGGFMQNVMGAMRDLGGGLDGALSHIPGWGVAKQGMEVAWWPVDKLASGAHWLYSEAISQPLSTLLLQLAKADLQGYDQLLSGSEWADAYGRAENIGPGQALSNISNVMSTTGEAGLLMSVPGTEMRDLSESEREQVRRNSERFLYDSDFWRDRQGWRYTVGTGALDFTTSLVADPAYAALKAGSAVVRGARGIQVSEGGARASSISERITLAVGGQSARDASMARSVNRFFDWAEGRNAAEIAQHPIWGSGRRANPAREQISQVLSSTSREDMPLLLRFAAGDNDAAVQLAERSRDTLIQIGRMNENRALVDSVRFDNELLQHFIREEQLGRTPARSLVEGIGGRSDPYTDSGRLAEPPFPRPAQPGPRQAGWDAAYGRLESAAGVYREAAGEVLTGLNGVRPMGGAAATSQADILRAEEWKANQLDLINDQLNALQSQVPYFSGALGALTRNVDDFSPGSSNIFGTVGTLYRMGPAAVRSPERAAEAGFRRLGQGRSGGFVREMRQGEGGFATRLFRNGFYTPAVRMVQSFGERIPQPFINHTDDDSYRRVSEMLRQVPGLGEDVRLDMINRYVQAGDKVQRSKILDDIHSSVVGHMASRYNLDPETAAMINEMRTVGFAGVMNQLTGRVNPSQRFSAAREGEGGRFVDFVEDGESYVISPLARTQLESGEILLPVRELDRFLRRHSGMLSSLRQGGGAVKDNVLAVADSLNTVWKATTLLRPGYVLRSMSEEQVASVVKFGMISFVGGAGRGGANWLLNRGRQTGALLGLTSYTPTIAGREGRAVLRITDEDALRVAERQGLPTQRIRVGTAWPLVQERISRERSALEDAEKAISDLRERGASQALIDDAVNAVTDHRNVMEEHVDYARALLQEARDAEGRRLGQGEFEVDGVRVPEAFSREWDRPIPRDQITSAQAMETIFARGEAIDTGRIIKTGDWVVVTPDRPNYMQSWLDGLNNQFRQDELFRLVAEDPTLQTARRWLRTAQGKYHMSQLGPRARDFDGTLNAIKQTLDQYLPEGTGLQARLGRGEEISESQLRAAIREEDFPPVHGEELRALTAQFSRTTASRAIDDLIESGFKHLSTVPNDVMARQPIYLRAQEARMRQFVSQEMSYRRSIGESDQIDMATLNRILEKSDRFARKDISQVVYDPTRTTATEALRFVTPFLSAHIDGLQRWGGLIAEKPQFLGRAAQIYNAPVAANLVTDRYGRPVGQDGYVDIRNEEGEIVDRQFVPMTERIMTLRMPGDTKNVAGVGEVPAGGIPISLTAINTILPGDPWFNPGAGPFVQVAASEIAKRQPDVGDFLQWATVLPYGPSEDWYDPLLPKYMREAWDAYTAGGADSEAYQRAYLAEYQRQMADYANGGEAPDMDDVANNARNFMYLEAFVSWASPAQTQQTPLTGSPYQFFADQYKAMQEVDPANAQEQFLARYGEDYFAFTASMSQSMGIAATISADETASRYMDLIERDPDMASLIIGDVYNAGEFSPSVYRRQMNQLIAGQRVRQPLSAEEAIAENQRDLGWQRYNAAMHQLDAALIRTGFTSYSQRGAESFQQAKRLIVDQLASQNEAWFEDFGEVQVNRMSLRIDAMRRITQDESLLNDPFRSDIRVLSGYLQARDALKAELERRGYQSISFDVDGEPTGENADLGYALHQIQLGLINMDTRFGDLFHRYLENDDLS